MSQELAFGLIFAILVIAAVAVPWFMTSSRRRQRRRYEDVPPAMRPAYSDEQLEKTVIERYMGWGLVLTALFAVFFPIYWIQESNRLRQAEAGLFTSSVARGETLFADNCTECHGQNARGAMAPAPDGGQWPAPDLLNIVERYEDNPNIGDVRAYVRSATERGRPGTPMPAWGQAYQGPLTDTDVDAVVDWIMTHQVSEEAEEASSSDLPAEDLFAQSCAKCHGPDAAGGEVGPSLVGVFERHSEEMVLGILRNGIVMNHGVTMPPWQNGYMYQGTRYDDETLARIVDYLESIQPDELPDGADRYQTPGVRQDGEDEEEPETADAAG